MWILLLLRRASQNQALIVNWRAKMTPLRGKMALNFDPSKTRFALRTFKEVIEESKDANYGNHRKDSSITLRARQRV